MGIISFVNLFIFGRIALAGGANKGGPSERILHGSNASIEQFPFMALTILLRKGSENLHTLCGGALITERWVISAAHCVHGTKEPYEISLGVIDRIDTSSGITYNIGSSGVFPHPNFRIKDPTSPDVLLYKLPSPVEFSRYPNVRTIPLARLPKNSVSYYDDKRVITLGWGITERGKSSRTLKYTYLKVFPNDKCHTKHPEISKAFICTEKFTQYSGPCGGDSGGPLVAVGSNGAYELVGITSHTKTTQPCLDPFSTDVYTYLPYHMDWIQRTMSANSRD